MNNEEYIKKAILKHGNKYDYSETNYIGSKNKIKVYCNDCKEYFYIRADNHLLGVGCQICSGNKKLTKEEFIERSTIIHNKYDYSLVEYINMKTKVKIMCPIHGIVEQTPENNLKYGCYKCFKSYKMNTQDFINKSIIVHGDRYDYSLVEYVNSKTKVKIICRDHDEFLQYPGNHINKKHNCPTCANIERRLKRIEEIKENVFGGHQVIPSFNKEACKLFDDIMIKDGIFIQHAMNGGEYYIKELGYWLDGYDKENNVAYEFDEEYHKYKKERDLKRQQEIEKFLGCSFIRIK